MGTRPRDGRSMRRACGLGVACLATVALAPAGAPPAAPRLVDVTAGSGLVFHHISGGEDEKSYIFETKGGGIGALDYDNDGLMDLFVAQGSTLERFRAGENPRGALFRNLGSWRFEDVTARAGLTRGAWGMGVTAADYDNDGWVDLYLANLGPNILYRNNGDGTFTDATARANVGDPRWSTSASFGDYDADGWLDLFVPNYLDVGPDKLPDAPGTPKCTYLGRLVMCGPRGLEGAGDSLYHNDGDGTFSEVGEKAGVVDRERFFGLGSVWADLDDDGDLDLYVANDATPNLLFVNQGNGTFAERGFVSGLAVSGDGREQASMGVDAADYDNDGLLDVFCAHFAGDYSTLYRNQGGLAFEDVTAAAGLHYPASPLVSWGARFVDLNQDGWKDLFHANGHVYPSFDARPNDRETYRQPQTLYLNLGGGRFVDASATSGADLQRPGVGRGAAFADFDNDGDVDIAVAQMNGSPRLFRNDQANAGHWVTFRTVGRRSNRDGIGARVTVTTGSLRQVWEVKRTVGIYSCSDPRAHFGLGAAARIERVEVRWPSGKLQELRGVAADRHYVLDEEAGLTEESRAPGRGATGER